MAVKNVCSFLDTGLKTALPTYLVVKLSCLVKSLLLVGLVAFGLQFLGLLVVRHGHLTTALAELSITGGHCVTFWVTFEKLKKIAGRQESKRVLSKTVLTSFADDFREVSRAFWSGL